MARRSKKAADKPAGDEPDGASDKVSGYVTMATGLLVSGFLLWRNRSYMEFAEYNLLNIACIFFVPLVVVLYVLRRDVTEFGMTSGDVKMGLLVALGLFVLFTPVLYFIAPQTGPQEYYLSWMGPSGGSRAINGIYWEGKAWSHGGVIDWGRLLFHEVTMAFYMFAWEWYHRGFLLNGTRKVLPVWGAVLFQAVLFTALHWGKPLAETASSFPGGILMALLALRFKSFLPCFLLHFLVSAGFDAAVLYFHFQGK